AELARASGGDPARTARVRPADDQQPARHPVGRASRQADARGPPRRCQEPDRVRGYADRAVRGGRGARVLPAADDADRAGAPAAAGAGSVGAGRCRGPGADPDTRTDWPDTARVRRRLYDRAGAALLEPVREPVRVARVALVARRPRRPVL